LNLSSDEDRRSSSRFPHKEQSAESIDKSGPSILLIEDNEADAFLVQQALKEHDVRATIEILRDGQQASDFIDAIENGIMKCPDLMILDLNLPKKSGHEVLAKMRSSGTCREVPVVILSSSAVVSDRNESKRLGAVRHIQKPSDLAAFMSIGGVLKALLSGQKT
jgi:CheY-like chemotaxis protein